MTMQNRADTHPVMAYRMILYISLGTINKAQSIGTYIARPVFPPPLLCEEPESGVPSLVAFGEAVAFAARSVAMRYVRLLRLPLIALLIIMAEVFKSVALNSA